MTLQDKLDFLVLLLLICPWTLKMDIFQKQLCLHQKDFQRGDFFLIFGNQNNNEAIFSGFSTSRDYYHYHFDFVMKKLRGNDEHC